MRTRVFAVRPPCVNNPEKKEPLAMEPASAVLASSVVEDVVAELSLVVFSSNRGFVELPINDPCN